MVRKLIPILIFIFTLAMVGCSTPEVGVPLGTYAPTAVGNNQSFTATPDPLDPSAYSTAVYQATALAQQQQALANEAMMAQATVQYQNMVATQRSEEMTRQVNNAATSTAVAITNNQTATSVAIEATERSIYAQSTAVAVAATATANSVNSLMQATVNAASAQGTANAIYAMSTLEADLAAAERDRMARENQAIYMREIRANVFMVVLLVLVVVVMVGAWKIFMHRQTPTIIERENLAPQVFIYTKDGLRPVALPSPQRQALPSNTISHPETVITTTEHEPLVRGYIGTRASWDKFSQWDNMRYIPIGAGENGPIMVDTKKKPHIMVAGETGAGKTRRSLWPIISACVASGAYVIVLNGRGADFLPFREHPNIKFIRGHRTQMPKIAYEFLNAAVQEMDRRDRVLYEHGVSTWNRLPEGVDNPAEIVIVIDEFLSLARAQSDNASRKAMMEAAIQLSAEARKFGIRLVMTVTSPTRRALGKEGMTIRDQCGRIAFTLNDSATSYSFINDHTAVGMAEGHFLANVGKGIQKGVSFMPDEQSIRNYLLSRKVHQVKPPQVLIDSNTQSVVETVTEDDGYDPNDPLNHEKAPEIISYYQRDPNTPMRQIEMAVFGYIGGEGHYIVKAVRDAFRSKKEVMA